MLNYPQISILTPGEFLARSKTFWHLLVQHTKTHWVAYVLIWLLWIVLSSNYLLAINESASLPQSVFVIHLHQPVSKGNYVAFTVPPDAAKHFKNPNATLTKIVVGMEGDTVSVVDRVVYVNNVPVGFAKPKSLKGEDLFPIEPVTVPKGMNYVMGLHKDSLDSRYTIVGLVPDSSIVGRAYPLL